MSGERTAGTGSGTPMGTHTTGEPVPDRAGFGERAARMRRYAAASENPSLCTQHSNKETYEWSL